MEPFKLLDITAYSSTFIAKSECLLGTSNCEFSNWVVSAFFKIENDTPVAYFEVHDNLFSNTVLFKTNDYRELKKWIEKHKEEIQNQIDSKAKTWIEMRKDIYRNT